jgi:sugar phosphate isomerase/epimerase
VADVRAALATWEQRIWIVSGGWCDFYRDDLDIGETFRSVERQVGIADELGVARMRLFFGRLKRDRYSSKALATISLNLRRLSDRYPDRLFAFENHDGASLCPAICREILETVDRPNIRMNFDPINFARAGVDSLEALGELQPLIAHVHLKGCRDSECCEFGEGDVDLTPVIQALIGGGYQGDFTVEYEGAFDRTIRLYESFRRAQSLIATVSETRA